MTKLNGAVRCSVPIGSGECGSAVFYDWGLQILSRGDYNSIQGGLSERFKDYASANTVKICARCNTPYLLEHGTLIDLSEELSGEDVRAILARGQATLPHVKIKDP